MSDNFQSGGNGGGVLDVIYDMRDRLIRMEESIKQVSDLKQEVKDMNGELDDVRRVAEEANQRSISNKERIDGFGKLLQWGIGLFVTVGGTVIALLGFIANYLVK